jgi:hypothetical protein
MGTEIKKTNASLDRFYNTLRKNNLEALMYEEELCILTTETQKGS